QLAAGEVADAPRAHQLLAQRVGCPRGVDQAFDRLAGAHDGELAARSLRVVTQSATCLQQGRGQQHQTSRCAVLYHRFMQVYLVGGAVRDQLLGREARERDWVVVGGTAEELAAAGYRPVGRDFPVFLHPETQEEYALARRERKSGPGYRGFVTEFSPDITLEEDLLRRDLTINAIARDADGNYIDPYGGRADIEARVLRHVSPAFAEDPVRILRLARFAARFAPLGFTVHESTLALARSMVEAGEADALVAERVWQETVRALGEPRPDVFFQVLRDCGALAVVFPEVDRLFGVPQPPQWHPEVDTGVHVLLSLRRAAELDAPVTVRFAVLVHDLGKGTTPK